MVVIGAGPQGLAAAAHLRGARAKSRWCWRPATVRRRRWRSGAHVRLFSAWPELVDPAAARLLGRRAGRRRRRATRPAGSGSSAIWRRWRRRLGDRVRYGTRVVGVSRRGRDRLVWRAVTEQPFTVHVVDRDGVESRIEARAVIDASGTWRQPNPAGADGLPALGERAAAAAGLVDATCRRPPAQADGLAGRHVVVVGSGHSAMTAVIDLADGRPDAHRAPG